MSSGSDSDSDSGSNSSSNFGISGRAKATVEFCKGFSVGSVELIPVASASAEFRDGWAAGRLASKDAIVSLQRDGKTLEPSREQLFREGFCVGASHKPIPNNGMQWHDHVFNDGWCAGRLAARDAVTEYLRQRGFSDWKDIPLEEVLSQ